ncbi:hypothetical protein ACFFX1_16960 [Dactylosporangium sucinum]|uniref:Uncharacterized protein n=1 Tax=Dactylosporangium sucinum TaxID=1424081 RepID=A0A917WSS4_9ACTN|nr:hypothetical protein [Dactylosporangium sucinum]GGM25829.1 hypothetical protein GCM10007977_028750 [Dactylosporangium sucinum]
MTVVNSGPYEMSRPDLAEARESLRRLYGAGTDRLWADLLRAAQLTGRETDPAALERLITAMLGADPVTALCGRSLAIRATTFVRLSSVHDLIRERERRLDAPDTVPSGG